MIYRLQGDVVGIYNANGELVTEYAYDAYGNCTIKQGAGMSSMVAVGIIAGVGAAIIIRAVGAGIIYLLGEGADLLYENFKEIIFER